jgi:sensor c-di-GMP phosphodiesterase-like protein
MPEKRKHMNYSAEEIRKALENKELCVYYQPM